jgi:hypothetical protein
VLFLLSGSLNTFVNKVARADTAQVHYRIERRRGAADAEPAATVRVMAATLAGRATIPTFGSFCQLQL